MAKAKRGSGDKYLDCVNAALEAAAYGPVRVAKAREAYQRYVDGNLEKGMGLNDARPQAMADVLAGLEKSAIAKKAKLEKNLKTIGDFQARLDEAGAAKQGRTATNLYQARISVMQDVDWLKTGRVNFTSERDVALGNIQGMFRNLLDTFSRNWAGINRAPIELTDIANEVYKPGSTSNQAAKDIAASLKKMYDYTRSVINKSGGMLDRKVGDELPFQPSAAKLEAMGIDRFVEYMKDANNGADWTTSGNGYFVRDGERDDFIRKYFNAITKEQWDKLPRPFEFTGGKFTREFNNQTIFKFKSGEAYAKAHALFMDGDFLVTTTRQMEKHAHNIGLIKVLGPSPEHMASVMQKMTIDATREAKLPGKALIGVNPLDRLATNVVDMALKHNPMDPEHWLGLTTNITSNLMSGAMLHAAFFASVAGDMMTMLANRFHNNEAIMAPLGDYLKAFVSPRTAKDELLAMGHTTSDWINQVYHTTHYNNLAALGATGAKWLADKTMKANLMNRHFDTMRAADTRMRSQSLFNARHTSYDNLREKFLLENNNITPAEWDKTRKAMVNHVYQPADNVGMFRPLDHVGALGEDLAHKWQLMFSNEAKRSVFESSLEARAIAMGRERVDTWTGALRASTFKFQTYGITYGLALARALVHAGTPGERMTAFVRMGLTAAVGAAIAMQVKSVWQGKTLMPMDASFWIKAIANGAAGPWGSVITGGMRADSATSIIKAIGGPYAQMLGDTYSNTVGSAFQYLDMQEGNHKFVMSQKGVVLLDFLRKYAIPETFWSQMAMQRDVLEPMEEGVNKSFTQKREKAQAEFAKKAGTPFRSGFQPGGRALGGPFGGNP